MKINKISPHLLQLTRSFLVNRKIKVLDEKENKISEYNLSAGMPQGSALSLTLFNAAISEVHRKIKERKSIHLLSFADNLLLIIGVNEV